MKTFILLLMFFTTVLSTSLHADTQLSGQVYDVETECNSALVNSESYCTMIAASLYRATYFSSLIAYDRGEKIVENRFVIWGIDLPVLDWGLNIYGRIGLILEEPSATHVFTDLMPGTHAEIYSSPTLDMMLEAPRGFEYMLQNAGGGTLKVFELPADLQLPLTDDADASAMFDFVAYYLNSECFLVRDFVWTGLTLIQRDRGSQQGYSVKQLSSEADADVDLSTCSRFGY